MSPAEVDGRSPGPVVNNTHDVYTRLRELLLNGEIPAGAILSQVKLARQLGVSTTPLREAMRLLQAEGLLIAEHNRMSKVAPLDPADIDAVYANRILIEAVAIRVTVPKLTAADDEALRALLDAMQVAASAEDLHAWEPIHQDFHRHLIGGCEPAVMRLIEPIAERCERFRRSSMFGAPTRAWEVGNDEHEAIAAACRARKPGLASELLARHYARSALTALAKLAPEQDTAAVRTALRLVQPTAA